MAQPTTYVDASGQLVSQQSFASKINSPTDPSSLSAKSAGPAAMPGSPSPDPSSLTGTAASQGLPAAPTTPAGAASIGANPDASKMAGTPAQLAAGATGTGERATPGADSPQGGVVAPTQSGEQTDQAEADKQASTQAGQLTQAEAADQARQQALTAAYGEVGLGVSNMISAALKQSAGNQAGASYVVPPAAGLAAAIPGYATLGAADQAAVLAALTKAATAANGSDPKALQDELVATQTAMSNAGLTPPTDVAGLQSLLTAQSVGTTTSAQIEKQITLTPDVLAQFGITNDDLALLGMTQQQAAGMSMEAFQTAIRDRLQQSRQDPASLQAQLADPNTDANTRQQINAELARMQTGGSLTAQQSAQSTLQNQIADPHDTISIGGQNMTVAQMLSDTNMSSLITQYVTSPGGSDIRNQIDKQFPALSQFITTNSTALTAAATQLNNATSTLAGAESSNNTLISSITKALGPTGNTQRDAFDAMMKSVDPNWGSNSETYTTSKIDASKSGVLQLMSAGLNGPQQTDGTATGMDLVNGLMALSKLDPAQTKQIMQMTPAELSATGLTTPATFTQFLTGVTQQAALKSGIEPDILTSFFGSADPTAVEGELRAKQVLGESTPQLDSFLANWSANGQGEDFAKDLGQSGVAGSVADLAVGKPTSTWTNPLDPATIAADPQGATLTSLAKVLGGGGSLPLAALNAPPFFQDNQFNRPLMQKILNSPIPLQQGVKQSLAAIINPPDAAPQVAAAPVVNQPNMPTAPQTMLQKIQGFTDKMPGNGFSNNMSPATGHSGTTLGKYGI